MASAFQDHKLRGMFAAFDVDGDGYLREDDFRALVARWSALPGVGPDTELRARLESLLMGWWAALRGVGDANGDGGVDMSELLALVDLLPTMDRDVAATAHAIFDAVDADGDGRISPEEHRRLVETWSGRPFDLTGVFELVDADGDGHLGREEFTVLWRQFWTSDDPAEPGNLLCGPFPGHPVP